MHCCICEGSAVATEALGATSGGNAQPAPTAETELNRVQTLVLHWDMHSHGIWMDMIWLLDRCYL